MAIADLTRIFEHNNWANAELIRFCSTLPDDQLDARPDGGNEWSIRRILSHLVEAQQGYLRLLTRASSERPRLGTAFDELEMVAAESGAGLVDVVRGDERLAGDRIHVDDGYVLEPWAVLVQAINHATEHRRQVADRLRETGTKPPKLSGWAFGEAEGAVVPPPK